MVQPEFLKLTEVHPERVAIAEQYSRMAGIALLRGERERAHSYLDRAFAEMSVVDVLGDQTAVSAVFGKCMSRILAAAGIVTIGQLRQSDESGRLAKVISQKSIYRIRKRLTIYGLQEPSNS